MVGEVKILGGPEGVVSGRGTVSTQTIESVPPRSWRALWSPRTAITDTAITAGLAVTKASSAGRPTASSPAPTRNTVTNATTVTAPTGARRVASCITNRHTSIVAKAISVRLDNEAQRALRTLESAGLTQSEAIRSSLLAAADRLRRGRVLAAEAAALEADETDRAEMLSVAAWMESMRAPG
jgi:hypothetical protein